MQKTLISALVLAAAIAASPVQAGSLYSTLVVFGDSLSDNGNLWELTGRTDPAPVGDPRYWQGRNSNGPVAVEWMAHALGATLENYAIAGAKTGPNGSSDNIGTGLDPFGLGITAQVTNYTTKYAISHPSVPLPSSNLYVVWGGPNDFNGMDSGADVAETLFNAVFNELTAIETLRSYGATHFFVPLMPNLGLTPGVLHIDPDPDVVAAAVAAAGAITDAYNGALQSYLGGVPGVRFFDTAAYLAGAVSRAPGSANYYSNVTDGCLLVEACRASSAVTDPGNPNATSGDNFDSVVPGNANGYLFWDYEHPSALAHKELGLALAAGAAVPEPESYLLLLAGLGVLASVAPRRRIR